MPAIVLVGQWCSGDVCLTAFTSGSNSLVLLSVNCESFSTETAAH